MQYVATATELKYPLQDRVGEQTVAAYISETDLASLSNKLFERFWQKPQSRRKLFK